MKTGKIFFEVGIGLDLSTGGFRYVVPLSDRDKPGIQDCECFLGDRDLPRYEGRRSRVPVSDAVSDNLFE